jgi:geranylgeranyl reductase family protein
MHPPFDVLIGGAGPAGSHAAALLAGQGMRVGLLDQARFPRDKVCGGGLSAKTLSLLGAQLQEVAQQRFAGALITWRDRATFVKDLGRVAGCTVLRSEFDAWLVRRAQAAGAQFHPQTRVERVSLAPGGVEVRTSAGMLRARLLLAADGVASAIRNQVFGRDLVRYAPAIEALIPAGDAGTHLSGQVLFDLGGMPRGYGWIFPKRDHLNVGVYSPYGGPGIRGHLDLFMRRHRLPRGGVDVRVCGYAIPVRNVKRVYERGPVWLLGDAAGFAESVFGEGIYFALKSAVVAARAARETAGACVTGAYTRLVRAQLEPELRWSERMGRLLYSMGWFAFDPLARSRVGSDCFAGLITGEVGYRACFWRTLLGAPRWLFGPRHALIGPRPPV